MSGLGTSTSGFDSVGSGIIIVAYHGCVKWFVLHTTYYFSQMIMSKCSSHMSNCVLLFSWGCCGQIRSFVVLATVPWTYKGYGSYTFIASMTLAPLNAAHCSMVSRQLVQSFKSLNQGHHSTLRGLISVSQFFIGSRLAFI